MTRADDPGPPSRPIAWSRKHRRAARSAVVAMAVMVAGAAAGLGWGLAQRTEIGLGSPTPSADSSGSPSQLPAATALPTQSPLPTMATPAPIAPPTPSATAELPAATTPEPPSAGPPITGRLAADAPPGFVSTISCEGAIADSDPVAIVRLRAAPGDELPAPVLRNYADVNAPRTACTFDSGDYSIDSLIDARHMLIRGTSGLYAVVELPAVQYHWFRLPQLQGGDSSFTSMIAVAPTLDAVIWSRYAGDGSLARQIYLTDSSGDHVLTDLPPLEGGRCGTPLDSVPGAYARTGHAYYSLDQLWAQVNVLVAGRGSDVELKLYPPDGGWDDVTMPLMPLWSPTSETLYYRVGTEIMRWAPGSTPELFLTDTPWSHPTFTPDGRHLAYATEEGVYLVDMTRDPMPRLVRADAERPIFVNSTQLWFKLRSDTGCVTERPEPRIYSLNDGSDAPSIIDDVIAIWPATSSQYR